MASRHFPMHVPPLVARKILCINLSTGKFEFVTPSSQLRDDADIDKVAWQTGLRKLLMGSIDGMSSFK